MPYRQGVQLDQVAFPVLLAGTLAGGGALNGIEVGEMVRRALGFIARNGPVSPQDRWEENSGVSAHAGGVHLRAGDGGGFPAGGGAGLRPGTGRLLERASRGLDRPHRFQTGLDRENGVHGHYLRIAPTEALTDVAALARVQPIKNRPQDPRLPALEQIGGDFLRLVRYGLRDPRTPPMRDSVILLDRLLRVELPQGPCWYLYTGSCCGECTDGRPYHGTGMGHPWPLLTGERGHYARALGDDALPYLSALAAVADGAGMFPEQVWAGEPLPQCRLRRGGATGSARPLARAHAEFVKLAFSLVLSEPARVRWRFDTGEGGESATADPGLGVHVVRLPAAPDGCRYIRFGIAGAQGDDGNRVVMVRRSSPGVPEAKNNGAGPAAAC